VRIVACVIATLFAGCTEQPIEDKCAPGDSLCDPDFVPGTAMVTAHWSFETLSGDRKAQCLPNNADVTLNLAGSPSSIVAPCPSGEWPIRVQAFEPRVLVVTSLDGHEYRGEMSTAGAYDGGDLPTVIVYTDAGYIRAGWTIQDAMSSPSTCEAAGIQKIVVLVDGVSTKVLDCALTPNHQTTLGPILAGTHDVRIDGQDPSGNIVATSSSVAVQFAGGTSVDANVTLHP
jgi:hypothetical protein